MRVVLVSTDLMSASRIQGLAAQAGANVRVASSFAAAHELLQLDPADVVIVDLTLPLADLEPFIAQRKDGASAVTPRVVAYGPHVHEDRLAAARAAGCDVVMSRGQFFAQVAALLTG